jgi:ATP-dependent DNA helicase RecQ
VLRGDVQLRMRTPAEAPRRSRSRTRSGPAEGTDTASRGAKVAPADLDERQIASFEALRQWRAEVAREHNLPAYVVFHDATLAEMARRQPASLAELGHISGVGAKKLEAYGQALLGVLGAAADPA